jgi:hypothetical protein
MKTRLLKSFIIENKQRCGVASVVCVIFVLFALTPGAAQLRTQRRVTALQLGGAAEGSRVTIVSDSALSDYEAFRRGDRFYVKIPLADFASALPRLRADGFEDVQVQKVGDGLVVSFKLQPGAAARVDQHGNRLDVVFSAANRNPYNNTVNAAGRAENTQGSADRGRDAAGPLPPGSVAASRDRFLGEGVGNEQSSSRNPWVPTNPQNAATRNSKGNLNNPSGNANPAQANAAASPSSPSSASSAKPGSSPSSVLTPGASSVYSPASATSAGSPTARPVVTDSRSVLTWRQRGALALQWASHNRLATLLAVLILLSLILYLLLALRNRKDKDVKAKQARTPKVQPKYSAAGELNEISSRRERTAPPEKKDAATAQAASETMTAAKAGSQSGVSDLQGQQRGPQLVNASAAAANASPNSQRVLTRPTITTPIAIPDEHREEEEREVFEL